MCLLFFESVEVWLLLRSLRTLHLRVQRQSATATLLAEWLQLATAGAPWAARIASLPSNHLHKRYVILC